MSETIGIEVEEVDLFQFVDIPFRIKVRLIDTTTGQIKTGQASTIKVLLGFEGNTTSDTRCREHHPHLLEVVSNTGIQDNGTGLIEVKITDVSMNHEHQRFVVYLEAYRTHGDNNILLATTNPITSVRHKLVISENNTQPYIWYKDEGAKDKCIKVMVKLIDSNNNMVKDRYVPLTASLVYSSGQTVQPLTVLSLFNDNQKPLVITSNGSEVVKFRVNEVSRNHRKQLFHLLVTADIAQDPSLADVSPATSIAFEVKSKRTSDARKEQMLSRGGDDEDNGDVIPLPASRLSAMQPLKKLKMEPLANVSVAGPQSSSSQPSIVMGIMGGVQQPMLRVPATMAENNTAAPSLVDPNVTRSMNDLKAQMDNSLVVNGGMRPTGGGGMMTQQQQQRLPQQQQQQQQQQAPIMAPPPSFRAGGLQSMGQGGGMMGGGMSREDIPEEVSYDVPFKAIYALAEWTNVAVNTLSATNVMINILEHGEQFNNPDLQQSIVQLVETYPGRAHSCLEYLKQFLALQEQRALQQYNWMAMMQQDHQVYRQELDSLLRANNTTGGAIPVPNGSNAGMRPSGSGRGGNTPTMNSSGNRIAVPMNITTNNSDSGNGIPYQAHVMQHQQQHQVMTPQTPQGFSMSFTNSFSGNNQQQMPMQQMPQEQQSISMPRGARVPTPTMGGTVKNGGKNFILQPMNNFAAGMGGGIPLLQSSSSQQQAASIPVFNNTNSTSRKRPAESISSSDEMSGTDLVQQQAVPESMVTNILGRRVYIDPNSEQLGFPAFSTQFPTGMRLVGFYVDSGPGLDETTGWRYQALSQIELCREPDLVNGICAEMLALLNDPNNHAQRLCFDISQYEGSLISMKRSVVQILTELEDNDLSVKYYLGQG